MTDLPDINKDELYGKFQDQEDWKTKLYRKLCYKSLDIGDDDLDIKVDNSRSGASPLMVAALTAASVVGTAALYSQFGPAAPLVQNVIEKVITETEVIDYDVDMEVIPPE